MEFAPLAPDTSASGDGAFCFCHAPTAHWPGLLERRALMRRAVVLVALTVVFSGVLEAQSKAPSRVPPKSTSPAVTATPALPTAWRNARWGMTAAEVLAAFPGEAAQLPVAVNYSDKYRGLVGIEGYQIA